VNRRAIHNKAPMRGVAMTVPRSITELKYSDLSQATYGCDTTGSVTLLNGVATGTDNTNRVGRHCTFMEIIVQGHFFPTNATASTNMCRVILVQDHQPNGALPAITDLLVASSATSAFNVNNEMRFKILSDKHVTLGTINTTATQTYSVAPGAASYSTKLRCKISTEYNGTSAAIGSLTTNSILLFTVGTQTSSNGYSLLAYTRVRFIDI
jgi:hypothetical protein